MAIKIKPLYRKILFFYLLLHLIALTSSFIGKKIMFETHSLTQREKNELFNERERLKQQARFEEENRKKQQWDFRSSVASKYLGREVVLTQEDRDTYWFKSLAKELKTKYEQSQKPADEALADIEKMAVIQITLCATDPLYDKGLGESTVYFDPNDPNYKVDRVHKYYILANADKDLNAKFWPFSTYKESYYDFGKANTYVFLGIFSGYDFSEFAFYVLLPAVIVIVVSAYRKFIK